MLVLENYDISFLCFYSSILADLGAKGAQVTGGDTLSETDSKKLETWIRQKYEAKMYALGSGALPEPKVLV